MSSAAQSNEDEKCGEEIAPGCQLIFVSGDESGVGKTTCCLGILSNALLSGYKASELAYIKPCTQCEDVQMLWKFCASEGIEFNGIGPITYRKGYTQECLDGQHGSAEDRLKLVKKAVAKLSEGRKLVVVDGVGYASVGSIVGCSNGQVAAFLNAPVIIIGRPGIGNAVDSFNMSDAYFDSCKATVIGAIFNKIPKRISYHKFEAQVQYVAQFFAQSLPQKELYGQIPVILDENEVEMNDDSSCKISCALKTPSVISLKLDEDEVKLLLRIRMHMQTHMKFDSLMSRIDKFYAERK